MPPNDASPHLWTVWRRRSRPSAAGPGRRDAARDLAIEGHTPFRTPAFPSFHGAAREASTRKGLGTQRCARRHGDAGGGGGAARHGVEGGRAPRTRPRDDRGGHHLLNERGRTDVRGCRHGHAGGGRQTSSWTMPRGGAGGGRGGRGYETGRGGATARTDVVGAPWTRWGGDAALARRHGRGRGTPAQAVASVDVATPRTGSLLWTPL